MIRKIFRFSFLLACFVQGLLNNAIGQKFVSINIVAPEQKTVTYGEIVPLTFEGTTKRGKVKFFEPDFRNYTFTTEGIRFAGKFLIVSKHPLEKDFTEIKFGIQHKKKPLKDSLVLPLSFKSKLDIDIYPGSAPEGSSQGAWFPTSGASGGGGGYGQNGNQLIVHVSRDTTFSPNKEIYLFEVFSFVSKKIDGQMFYYWWEFNEEGVIIRANGGRGGDGGQGSSGSDGTNGGDGGRGGNGGDGGDVGRIYLHIHEKDVKLIDYITLQVRGGNGGNGGAGGSGGRARGSDDNSGTDGLKGQDGDSGLSGSDGKYEIILIKEGGNTD